MLITKPIRLAIAFLLLHGIGYAQPKNDLFILGLHGKVKKLTITGKREFIATGKSGSFSKRLPNTTVINFDETGNISEATYMDKEGKVITKISYQYDDSGYCVKGSRYDANDDIYFTFICKYDRDGNRLIENILDNRDSLVARLTFTYNAARRKEVTSYYYPPDSLNWQEKCFYEDNLMPQISRKTMSGKKTITYRFAYEKIDGQGNWQKCSIYVINSSSYKYEFRQIEYY